MPALRAQQLDQRNCSYQAIVAFVLPKRVVTKAKDFIGSVGCESFQRPQPLCEGSQLSGKQVDMIRHDNKRMHLASVKTEVTVDQCVYDQFRYLWEFQVKRTGSAFVE